MVSRIHREIAHICMYFVCVCLCVYIERAREMNGERRRRSPENRSTEERRREKLRWSAVEFWESAGTIRETDEYGVVGFGFL